MNISVYTNNKKPVTPHTKHYKYSSNCLFQTFVHKTNVAVHTVNTRVCLKKAFCKMCVTICGRFCPDEGVVAGYGNRIQAKYTAQWGVQIAKMFFQTRSSKQITHAGG